MKTVIPSGKDIPRNWHIIDAENLVLGRVATKAANILMGKHKPSYTPYIDMGDHIIVINAVTATLNGNNTYAVAGTGTEDGDASTVITDAGTYSQSGSTLNFTSTMLGGATYSATAQSDSSFTVSLPGGFVDSDRASFSLLFEKGN